MVASTRQRWRVVPQQDAKLSFPIKAALRSAQLSEEELDIYSFGEKLWAAPSGVAKQKTMSTLITVLFVFGLIVTSIFGGPDTTVHYDRDSRGRVTGKRIYKRK
jgi:hypothetical protein